MLHPDAHLCLGGCLQMMHRLSEPIKLRCLKGDEFNPALWRSFFALGMGTSLGPFGA